MKNHFGFIIVLLSITGSQALFHQEFDFSNLAKVIEIYKNETTKRRNTMENSATKTEVSDDTWYRLTNGTNCVHPRGWVYTSWCVETNIPEEVHTCKISNHYMLLSERRNNVCGEGRRCCIYRKEMPSPSLGRCGVTYFEEDNYRITGGKESAPGQWPFVVSIESRVQGAWKHVCGATLLNRVIVLTAAHCFKYSTNPSDYRLVLGQHTKLEREEQNRYVDVEIIYTHGDFENTTAGANDLAMLLMAREVEYNEYIQPICHPRRQFSNMTSSTVGGTRCVVMGFGYTDQSHEVDAATLRHAEIDLYDQQYCYTTDRVKFSTTHNLCGGRQTTLRGVADACQGDSGGPLACMTRETNRWTLVGIVSWGDGCGRAWNPGYYLNVMPYMNWIRENARGLKRAHDAEKKRQQEAERKRKEAEKKRQQEAERKRKEAEKKRQQEAERKRKEAEAKKTRWDKFVSIMSNSAMANMEEGGAMMSFWGKRK